MSLTDEVRLTRAMLAPEVARHIRINAGVSQERFARELGVTRMTISRWERGKRQPLGALRVRYAQLLDQLKQVAA